MSSGLRMALGASLAFGISCGEGDLDVGGEPAPSADAGSGGLCFSSSECPTGWTCSEFGQCLPPPDPGADGGVEPAPEVEYEIGDPVSSRRYVYVAMTDLDALAKIDGATQVVTSVGVGESPEVVAAAPGSDIAVVLDSINGTATVVRPTELVDERTVFGTLPHLNQMVIDPTGSYAVAWFDLQKAVADSGGLGGVGPIGSFQDVSIVALSPGNLASVDLSVGFRPREVEFDDAGTRAFVVTDDGVSVIDLAAAVGGGPSIAAPIPVSDDPFEDPQTIEVDIVGTGAYAVVRQADRAELRVVTMTGPSAGESWVVPLSVEPSDVDLSPDGSRAYAALRGSSQLAVIDIPEDAIDPAGVELIELGTDAAGSLVLSSDGNRAALFTNATLREEITLIELSDPSYPLTTWPLQKSIRFIKFDPTGSKILLFHAKAPGDPDEATSFDEFIDRSHGYSLLDVATGFAKLQITPVEPTAMAFAPAAPRAFVSLDGGDAEGAVAEAHTIELDTGVVRTLELGSPPDALGILPDAEVVFVSQRHSLGRITFMEIASGQVRTLTGFDLNSRVVD